MRKRLSYLLFFFAVCFFFFFFLHVLLFCQFDGPTCTNLPSSFLSQGFPPRLPPQYPGDSNIAPSSSVASVCIPSAVLSPPMSTEALAPPGYFPTVVQPYVESNFLVPVGSLGGQVQVSQPAVSLAQAPTTSSQQAALEVNGISACLYVKHTHDGMKITKEKLRFPGLGLTWRLFQTNFWMTFSYSRMKCQCGGLVATGCSVGKWVCLGED